MTTTSIEASNLFHVKGLVAVITGGGSGIWLMVAWALAANGAHKAYIIGRRQAALENAAKSVTTGNIILIVGDVTSKESLKSIADRIEREAGYINILIANSGIGGPHAKVTPETTLEDFQKQMWEIDFDEYVNTISVNTAAVRAEKSGHCYIPLASGGFNKTELGGYAYGQSKVGTTHMMKQLTTALVPYRIRSNTLCPGLYPSNMAASNNNFPTSLIPLERVGTEEEMAGEILYLTSLAGGYCNGNILVTGGGGCP